MRMAHEVPADWTCPGCGWYSPQKKRCKFKGHRVKDPEKGCEHYLPEMKIPQKKIDRLGHLNKQLIGHPNLPKRKFI